MLDLVARWILSALGATVALLVGCGSSENGGGGGGNGGDGSGLAAVPDAGLGPCDCAPGERAGEDGSCVAAGVSVCADGYELGEDGCMPLRPATPCEPGQMALPGETQCREVAPCGSGIWGDIPTDATTQFVDASHTGGSNGTADNPWKTIQQGIDAAAAGAVVAVTTGVYAEAITIGEPVQIWGRCPADVTISGASGQSATVVVSGTTEVELHDISVSGGEIGIAVLDSAVVIDRAWIHDTGSIGVYALADPVPTSVTLDRSLVESATGHALYLAASEGTVRASELRDTKPEADGTLGRGITALDHPVEGLRATVTVLSSALSGNRDYGIRAAGSDVVIRDSLVADTAPQASDGSSGNGVMLRASLGTHERSAAELERVVIEGSHECGLCIYNSDAVVIDTTVRRTARDASLEAQAIFARGAAEVPAGRPELLLRSSTISDVEGCGLITQAADATIEGLVVRDTQSPAGGCQGYGLTVRPDWETMERSDVVIKGSRIQQVVTDGVLVQSSDVAIDTTLVSDVALRSYDSFFGRGISLEHPDDSVGHVNASITCSRVERVHEFGIAVVGAEVLVESTVVDGVMPSPSFSGLSAGVFVQGSFAIGDATNLQVVTSEVNDAGNIGIGVAGARLSVAGTRITGTDPGPGGLFGDGITALPLPTDWGLAPAQATVEQSVVDGSARAGIATFGGEILVGTSLLRCNRIHLAADSIDYLEARVTNRGEVACGCDDERVACKVLSSSLEPPPVLGEPSQTDD